MGIIPSKRRWERKQRARDRQVKFQGQGTPVSTVSLRFVKNSGYRFTAGGPCCCAVTNFPISNCEIYSILSTLLSFMLIG